MRSFAMTKRKKPRHAVTDPATLKWVGILVFGAVVISAFSIGAPAFQDQVRRAANREDHAGAREAFLAAYKVFMHPRCMNCHPAGDAPFQGDDSHLHSQN